LDTRRLYEAAPRFNEELAAFGRGARQ
jgi:hypothetical protein